MKDIITKDLLTSGVLPARCDFIDVSEPGEVSEARWD